MQPCDPVSRIVILTLPKMAVCEERKWLNGAVETAEYRRCIRLRCEKKVKANQNNADALCYGL